MELRTGDAQFTTDDLQTLSDLVADTWAAAADADWTATAGTLDWSCMATADHAVDCVYAPAFFLASRRHDDYPDAGGDLTLGDTATPERLVESLRIATTILVAVVKDAPPDARAIIFRGSEPVTADPSQFPPRAALELMLHAHDVCAGLRVGFEPPADLAYRLREHTRPWPMWSIVWSEPGRSDDPWGDLLTVTGRQRTSS